MQKVKYVVCGTNGVKKRSGSRTKVDEEDG